MTTSSLAHTPKGDIEYAVAGEGPAVLAVHGALGGFEQGMVVGGYAAGHGFRVVAPSRPGYRRTPLETGAEIEEQADAMAALLDELGIDRVALVGGSAGGPPAIQFALRHPDRTWALVLLSAITKPPSSDVPLMNRIIFGSRIGLKLMGKLAILSSSDARFVRQMVKTMSTFKGERAKTEVREILADPSRLAELRAIMPASSDWNALLNGMINDVKTGERMQPYPLEKIACPTLVVHGRADGSPASFDNAEHAIERIPGAELYAVDEGWHCLYASRGGDGARKRIVQFLTSVAP